MHRYKMKPLIFELCHMSSAHLHLRKLKLAHWHACSHPYLGEGLLTWVPACSHKRWPAHKRVHLLTGTLTYFARHAQRLCVGVSVCVCVCVCVCGYCTSTRKYHLQEQGELKNYVGVQAPVIMECPSVCAGPLTWALACVCKRVPLSLERAPSYIPEPESSLIMNVKVNFASCLQRNGHSW